MAELDFSKQVNNILTDYSTLKEAEVKQIVLQNMKEARQEVSAASPRRSGAYAKSWAVKNKASNGSVESVVFNKDRYRLTHLLEYGHVIRNKAGGRSYGKTSPRPHIGPVDQATQERIMQQLEEAFKR